MLWNMTLGLLLVWMGSIVTVSISISMRTFVIV